MPLAPGATLDRYVIEALLGAGGMGEVYRARDTRLQRSVALKVMRDDDGPVPSTGGRRSTGGAARMLREARVAAALDHPNVIAIYDVGRLEAPGELQGTTYIAMELIKGSTLRAYVGDARVPILQRVRWLVDVARALAAAHAVGLVHRDVKPENVMIREDGIVKVLDFGIARRMQTAVDALSSTEGYVTAEGAVVGTPMYMAPEQLRAEPLDARADQFAWGVMAHELLAGAPPWSLEGGGIALVSKILSAPAPPLVVADLPEGVAAIVARALEKDRAARFATMNEVIDALAHVTDGVLPVSSLRPPAPRSVAPSPLASSKGGTAAFVSAPTEAVMTPAPSRRARESEPRSAAASGRRKALAAVAGTLAIAAAIGAATLHARRAGPVVADAAPAVECTANAACVNAHGGAPWICRAADHRCVALPSDECRVLAAPGDVESDATVWLGAIYPLSGPAAFPAEMHAVDLARRDFAETLGRVAGARRIALVACDGARDVGRVARHLADDVRVPAVMLGISGVSDIVDVVTSVLAPRDVLVMLPLSASPTVTSLPSGPSGRLVWRSTYSTRQLSAPFGAFVERVLEPRLRASGVRRTRVAVLRDKSIAARDFSALLLSRLRINGVAATDAGDDFREITYDESDASIAAARDAVVAFGPSIIVGRASPEVERRLVAPIEDLWRARAPRPVWLVPFAPQPELIALASKRANASHRFFWIDSLTSRAADAQLANHYNDAFDDKVTRATLPGTSYDGAYALAFAVHALGEAPVTGPSMASAFRRFVGPGETILVGPQSIVEAYGALVGGRSIDLEGTSSHLDFDPATGEPSTAFTILCLAPGESGEPPHTIESGLTYEAPTGLTGTMTCR